MTDPPPSRIFHGPFVERPGSERRAVGRHPYHDPGWDEYNVEQREMLGRVHAFSRDLAAAGDRGMDLTGVLDYLDPDPVRYMWVDEGGGLLDGLLEEARGLLGEAPVLDGHVRFASRPLGTESASRPTVAGAADGRLLVAWIRWQQGVGDQVVTTILRADGSPLVGAEPISGPPTDCFRPRALFDTVGDAWVFYARAEPSVGGSVSVYARRHDGTRWSPEERVSDTGHPSFNHEVLAHSDGVECVWQARKGRGFGIYRRRRAGGTWTETTRVDNGDGGGSWDPTVARLGDGSSLYVWSAYVDGAYRLRARRGDGAGMDKQLSLTAGTDYALHPAVAAAGDGSVWCAFDLVTVQAHGGSGPTALQPADRLGTPPVSGMRAAGAYFPAELRPNVTATLRLVRIDEDGLYRPPGGLGEGVDINPCAMPALAAAPGGGVTLAYRILRRLPLLHYYWEVAVQQVGPDGIGPVCTVSTSDAGIEEPALASTTGGMVVAATHDGRRERALEWSEGFGGRRCVELITHLGEIVWHGMHRGGDVVLAELPDVAEPSDDVRSVSETSSLRHEARSWIAGPQDPYTTEVGGETRTLYWGDLHRHSLISRCTSADDPGLDDLYRYAWDVCDYDFWAVTDHAENSTDQQWWSIKKIADLFHAPGAFVPFYGFEWTSELGHQNVIFGPSGRDAPIFSSTDTDTDTPAKLWDRLRRFPRHPAITIPHHPGADMAAYDWGYYDPQFLRLVEVFQACRGNYEDTGAFRQYSDATLDGTFVVDGLRRGHRFGLIASTDHGYGASYVGAYAEDLTRESVFDALRARRTIAATARGILLDVRIGDTFLGGELTAAGPHRVEVFARGYCDLARIDVIQDGVAVHSIVPRPDLPGGWVAVPVRVEWGRAKVGRDWSGTFTIDRGEILQTPWWAPEIREVTPTSVRWSAHTSGFGGGGIYGPTRGGVEFTVAGPPDARIQIKTVSGALSCTLADLQRGSVVAGGPDGPVDGLLRLQAGIGGLLSLGSSSFRFGWDLETRVGATWCYVRAIQVDGEMAWSSPIWVDPPLRDS